MLLFAEPGSPRLEERSRCPSSRNAVALRDQRCPRLEACSSVAASEVSLPFFGPLLHEQRQIEEYESPLHLNADKHDGR